MSDLKQAEIWSAWRPCATPQEGVGVICKIGDVDSDGVGLILSARDNGEAAEWEVEICAPGTIDPLVEGYAATLEDAQLAAQAIVERLGDAIAAVRS
jgi:hypothetical protein